MTIINADIILRGSDWSTLLDAMDSKIFKSYYQIFVLCVAIGIFKDEKETIKDQEPIMTIPRSVVYNDFNKSLDYLFKVAVITTKHLDSSPEKRLAIAFDENNKDISRVNFLVEFGNAGMRELLKTISKNDLEMMQNIKDLLDNLKKRDFIDMMGIELDMDFNTLQ